MINERSIKTAKSLHKKGIPFIILKYDISCLDIYNTVYELLFIKTDKVETRPLEREDALIIIKKLELPSLHKDDGHTVIWGNPKFKEKYHELKANGYEYNYDD